MEIGKCVSYQLNGLNINKKKPPDNLSIHFHFYSFYLCMTLADLVTLQKTSIIKSALILEDSTCIQKLDLVFSLQWL